MSRKPAPRQAAEQIRKSRRCGKNTSENQKCNNKKLLLRSDTISLRAEFGKARACPREGGVLAAEAVHDARPRRARGGAGRVPGTMGNKTTLAGLATISKTAGIPLENIREYARVLESITEY